MIDPATGLPVDENGNILGAEQAGSNIISESDFPPLPPYPGEATEAPSPISTPSAPPAATPQPAVQKQSGAVSMSYSGITPEGIAATTSLNKKADAAARSDVAQFNPMYQQWASDAENVAKQRSEALRLETEAHKQHANEELELWKQQQHFISEQADLEKIAFSQSQVVKQQYLANYENDLAAAKMLAMQTGDPYERMGGAQAFGLIADHAVQGFLRVGGHNIDVAAQTDRWVNREIAKHSERVQNARASANDQLHLYELARQNSRDDYEARERYRGMVLEGLKAQVGMEAARFQSQLANATAAQKQAEIDAQLTGIKMSLGEKQQGLYFEAQKMRIQQAAQQAEHSRGMFAARTARMQEERLAKEQEAKTIRPTGELKLPDPGATERQDGKIIGVKNMFRIRRDATDAMKKEALDLHTKEAGTYAAVMGQLNELRKLRAPVFDDSWVMQYGPQKAKEMFNAEYRAYKRQKDLIGEATVQAFTGAAAPEAQMKRLLGILADDSGWQKGGNAAGLDQLEKYWRTNFVTKMNTHGAIETLPVEEQDIRPYGNASNDTDASYGAQFGAKGAMTTPVDTAASSTVALKRNDVTMENKYSGQAGGVSPSFSAYMRETGDRRGLGTTDNSEKIIGQRGEIDSIDYLAALVAKPEIGVQASGTVNGQPTVSADEVRQDAFQTISAIAAGQPLNAAGQVADEETQKYAAWVKARIEVAEDPEAFYRDVYVRIHEDDSNAKPLNPGSPLSVMHESFNKPPAPEKPKKRSGSALDALIGGE